MRQIFIESVCTDIDKIAAKIKVEALKEWEQHRQNTGITPMEADQLARDFVTKSLAMDLYYRLSINPSKL